MRLKKIFAFQNALLAWYRENARDLPWRRTKHPYKIWASEIMLQQTQVATVLPYYRKWLKRFPTLQSLAAADLSEVLGLWAGLGYYRRARMLHQAAAELVKQGKEIPSTARELQKLPGIGRYTAGAIASIAFGKRAPILDGNVIRVLARIQAMPDDIGSPQAIKKLWKYSEKILPEKNPGDFNQAMMELGAVICIPENPRCLICPAAKFCRARAMGRPSRFPVKKQKEVTRKIRRVALILKKKGRVLIQRQPERGRWGGLWIFPFWNDLETMRQEIKIKPEDLTHRLTIHHGFTKYRIRLDVYEGTLGTTVDRKSGFVNRGSPRVGFSLRFTNPDPRSTHDGYSKAEWVSPKRLSQFAFPSPHQKIVEALVKENA